MKLTSDNLTTILTYAVIITVTIAATVLCALGQLSATATVGLYGVIIGGHGAALLAPTLPGGPVLPSATGEQPPAKSRGTH